MAGRNIRSWIAKWRIFKNHGQTSDVHEDCTQKSLSYEFSPMTYQNPCISHIHEIVSHVLEHRQLSYRRLELIVVDAEMSQDSYDIESVLEQMTPNLNYLLLVTDRPAYYEDFVHAMYQENGLIVQQISKADRGRAHGNMVMDFERSGAVSAESMIGSKAIYLPIYKKPWEIGENLDIMVPVGYNTLVIEGIFLPEEDDREDKIDRLDQEFRKG